jgi:hypothetical protein
MTFQDFLEKYNGKYIDFDGYYGAQCMDLEHQYCLEVLGIGDHTVLAAPSAKEVYNNFPTVKGNELFEQIGNTPTNTPQEGDIMFWGSGTWGHVAVFVEGDANSFRSFDQNYPTGSPCHIQNHINYTGVLGWLRFKGHPIADNQAQIDQLRAERDTNWNLYQQERDAKIALETQLDQKNKTVLIMEKTIQDKDKELDTDLEALQSLRDTNAELSLKNGELRESQQKTEMDLEICLAQRKDLAKYTSKELWVEIVNRLFRR